MADISQINIDNTSFDIKDSTARSGLSSKQDVLTPGENISIEKNASGNTVISSDGGSVTVITGCKLYQNSWTQNNEGRYTQKYSYSNFDTDKVNTVVIDPSQLYLWSDCNVYATGESSTGIDFICDEIPEETLTFKITTVNISGFETNEEMG